MKRVILFVILMLIFLLSSCNTNSNLSNEINYDDPYAYGFYTQFYELDSYIDSGTKNRITITSENYQDYLDQEICLEIDFFVNGSNYLYNDELDLFIYYSGVTLETLEANTIREASNLSNKTEYNNMKEFVFKKINYASVMKQQFVLKCTINSNVKLHIESNKLTLLDYSLDFISK